MLAASDDLSHLLGPTVTLSPSNLRSEGLSEIPRAAIINPQFANAVPVRCSEIPGLEETAMTVLFAMLVVVAGMVGGNGSLHAEGGLKHSSRGLRPMCVLPACIISRLRLAQGGLTKLRGGEGQLASEPPALSDLFVEEEEEPSEDPVRIITFNVEDRDIELQAAHRHSLWGHLLWNSAKCMVEYLLEHAEEIVGRQNVEVVGHKWGSNIQQLKDLSQGRGFDLVLISDVVFNHYAHVALLRIEMFSKDCVGHQTTSLQERFELLRGVLAGWRITTSSLHSWLSFRSMETFKSPNSRNGICSRWKSMRRLVSRSLAWQDSSGPSELAPSRFLKPDP
eukprot:767025-Hanusia_phi.AAC.1